MDDENRNDLNQDDQNSYERDSEQSYHSDYDQYRNQTPDGYGRYSNDEYDNGSSGDDSGSRTDFYNTQKSSGRHSGYNNNYSLDPKPPKKKNTGRIVIGVLIVALAAVVIALLLVLARGGSSSNTASSEQSASSENQVTLGKGNSSSSKEAGSSAESVPSSDDIKEKAKEEESESGNQLSVVDVTKKVMPSMVAITNTSVQQYQDFFGETYDKKSVSAGSGIIVGETDDNILIATNNHVISDSNDITVTFVDNSAIAGTVQGTDADNDLAIVSVKKSDIPESTQKQISIVSIGDSDNIQVGEQVVAIGNALGYGQSVSSGIVSALNREVTDSDGTTRKVIQTDASINPGNSGGALLNMEGELIGINEAKLVDESVEGVGYAIPMSIAEPILTKLGNKATRQKVSSDKEGYLGISCVTMPSSYTQQGYPEGVYVASVVKGGPADKAGIKQGDIITSFDGNSVGTKESLLNLLEYYAKDEKVEVSISRLNSQQNGFDKKKVTVTLGSRAEANLSTQESAEDSDDDTDQDTDDGGLFGFFNN